MTMRPQDATEHDVQELAKNFLKTVENFRGDDLAYAKDGARGEYKGFAALHDRMDANVVLDDELDRYGVEGGWDEEADEDAPRVALMCRVINAVNVLLIGHVPGSPLTN